MLKIQCFFEHVYPFNLEPSRSLSLLQGKLRVPKCLDCADISLDIEVPFVFLQQTDQNIFAFLQQSDQSVLDIFPFNKTKTFSIWSSIPVAKNVNLENKFFDKSYCKSWTMSFLSKENFHQGTHCPLFELKLLQEAPCHNLFSNMKFIYYLFGTNVKPVIALIIINYWKRDLITNV